MRYIFFALAILAIFAIPSMALAQNLPPVADAGPDMYCYTCNWVTLHGSAVDPEGDPIYSWSWAVVQRPPDFSGGYVQLLDQDTPDVWFLPESYTQGDYVLSLTVWDGISIGVGVDYVTVHVANNLPPIAVATADKGGPTEDYWWIEGPAPLTVQFDGSGSYDPDPQGQPIAEYYWDFGDGSAGSSSAVPPPHTYTVPGVYNVVHLTVTDELGAVGTATIVIAVTEPVNNPPVADLKAAVGALPPGAFKNGNQQNALDNKIDVVIAMIENGDYASAVQKLENDILGKTDGCANSGGSGPDKNDWIESCGDQAVIYPLVLDAIAAVRDLM